MGLACRSWYNCVPGSNGQSCASTITMGEVRVDEGTNFWSTTSKEVKPDDQTVQGFLTLKEKPFKLKFALQVYPENPRTSLLRPSKRAIPDPCHRV